MTVVLLFITVVLLARAAAETLDFRLPHANRPIRYRLDLQPHFQDDNFTFYGQVWIDFQVQKESPHITLHSKGLEIFKEAVTVEHLVRNETLEALPFSGSSLQNYVSPRSRKSKGGVVLTYEPARDMVHIKPPFRLSVGSLYRLYLRYKGQLSDTLIGFYKSSYVDSNTKQTRWLASTTFEPNEARKAFPCFDEPGFKARFQVNLAHRDDVVALSNMPQRSSHNMTGASGWTWSRFKETPIISSYLVAFFVGHLEAREAQTTSGKPFRIWARPDVLSQSQYALDIGPGILDFFNDLLGVKEPMPKYDILALPAFVADALENWGLISFGEKYLLHEPGSSRASNEQQVAHIVAHELAHSWFGNMVSVRWWKDIWLNEGFATYFSTVGANFVNPKWDTFSMTTVTAFLHVFSVDSLHTSHPLTYPINHQHELRQIFDSITYYKGYYILRMLNHSLGESTFLKGCGRYVKEHVYGAVDQQDLWTSLTKQAHEDGVLAPDLELGTLMESWTSRPGFPVVTVTRNYVTDTVTLTQARFERPKEDMEARLRLNSTDWWIPLTYTTQEDPDFETTKPQFWLNPEHIATELTGMPDPNQWILFNVQAAGLYRVNYDQRNWKLISQFLNSGQHESISVLNRALLLDDALDLARVGLLPYNLALGVTSYLRQETHYLPWKSALSNIGYISRMLRLTDGLASFNRYIQFLVEPQFEILGFDLHQNDSYLKSLHHKEIVRWACNAGHHSCVQKAITLFDQWMHGEENPIPNTLKSVVYCTAVSHGGPPQWQFLWSQYMKATAASERNSILKALGCSEDTDILRRYLGWSTQKESGVKAGDRVTVFKAVASTDVGFTIAKNFFFKNISSIEKTVGPFHVTEILEIIGSRMNQPSHLRELEEFQRKNSLKLQHFTRTVSQVNERVKYNIQWLQNNFDDIYIWLQLREPTPLQLYDFIQLHS